MTGARRSRRDFVLALARLAGAAPAALHVIGGAPAAAGEDADMAILYAAIGMEQQAIDLYERGVDGGMFAGRYRDLAAAFRGDHVGHRDTQIQIARERGGRAPDEERRYPYRPRGEAEAWIREALRMELAAEDAYSTVLRRIDDADQRLAAAYILVDEVQHLTVWREVLGVRLY
jgi:hypothetical protein